MSHKSKTRMTVTEIFNTAFLSLRFCLKKTGSITKSLRFFMIFLSGHTRETLSWTKIVQFHIEVDFFFESSSPNSSLRDDFKLLSYFLLTKLDVAFLFAFGFSGCQRLWLTSNLLWSQTCQRYSHCFQGYLVDCCSFLVA